MLSDIEIAQNAKINPITQVAESIGIDTDKLELYGKYKAKLPLDYVENLPSNPNVKLILVTAMNPTPAGEHRSRPGLKTHRQKARSRFKRALSGTCLRRQGRRLRRRLFTGRPDGRHQSSLHR